MTDDYRWLTNLSQTFLKNDYLVNGQTVDQRVDEICNAAEKILNKPGFAARFKENFKKGWYSLSTPIWANFGTDRGMPISCFGSYMADTTESIAYTHAEVMMMTKHGGGTSAHFGELRSRGSEIKNNGQSDGAVHFMRMFDSLISVISQGSTRRGNFAAYLPIDHKDITEFLTLRSEGSPIQDLSFGVTVPDYWIKEMIAGDKDKRKTWARVLECRANTGYPYIIFIDNANNNTVDVYKDKGMKINNSNLCTEIFLPTNEEESFVCDLSSMNILYYDEWKDTDAVELLVYLLDAVMTEFIEKASKVKFMERAVRFATRHRAIGVGWLGWHSYLQSKMIAFESAEAKRHNVKIAKNIKEKAYAASAKMAQEYGEPEVLAGYGRRHTTLMAIAPTKSCTTPDTKFKDSNLNNIDYFEFAKRGGLDLNEIMSIEIEFDDGKIVKYHYDEQISDIMACNLTEFDIPNVKNIRKPEKQWFKLNQPVKVFTDDGIKECKKFYFNGFEPVYELTFSDGNKYKFTGNHRLKDINNEWMQVDAINDEFVSNNNLKLVAKEYIGVLPTMDMEVPDVHYYVLSNGVHSHNSSFILGQVSEGIEPHRSNYYIKDLAKGKFTIKNNHLEQLLESKGQNLPEVWESILRNAGSVQHLDCLTDDEKLVFKTFAEISQKECIIQAAQRQKYIDQGQSLNLMIHPSIPIKDVNALILEAWELGIKSLYYQISVNAAQSFSRDILACASCQS